MEATLSPGLLMPKHSDLWVTATEKNTAKYIYIYTDYSPTEVLYRHQFQWNYSEMIGETPHWTSARESKLCRELKVLFQVPLQRSLQVMGPDMCKEPGE